MSLSGGDAILKIAHQHGSGSHCKVFSSGQLPLRLNCLSSRSGLDTLHDSPEHRLPEVLLAAGAAPAVHDWLPEYSDCARSMCLVAMTPVTVTVDAGIKVFTRTEAARWRILAQGKDS